MIVTVICQHCAASFTAAQRTVPSIATCPTCSKPNAIRARKVRGGPAAKPKHQASR